MQSLIPSAFAAQTTSIPVGPSRHVIAALKLSTK
jgi:hypothetical protein